MSVFFISRHHGALEWAKRQGLEADRLLSHLSVETVQSGDVVVGTLPIHLAAQVCARGAQYVHLSLDIPASERGRELSADDLERFGARLEAYAVQGPFQPVGASRGAM